MVDVSIKLNIEVDEGQVSIAELRAKVEAIANRIADELVDEGEVFSADVKSVRISL